ncbi:MAG TPA: EAL domain-containing protein, partial [Solirubrobacteraceae bacterium]|nr:EAL domain-containing protein [Solirubrobacteraceae bacterium]
VDGVRRELAGILAEALELSARGYLRTGDTRAAAAAAARLVEAEPYNDAAHRLRIEALAAGGDRAGALRAYEHLRATLAADVGVEPSAETQAALRRALDQSPDVRPADAPAPDAEASPLASLSVLVVDDHDFQRRTALALLGRLGVGSLTEARDGVEALERLAAAPPDVIVCDIDMPGMDGVEFIRHVAERRLASAVVIASGLDRSVLQAVEAVGEGYGLQVLGAVEKPLTARRLSELLAAYRRPPPTQARAEPVAATDAELRAGLDEGRIGASFLPIVDLQNGAVSGARLVATWQREAGATPCVVGEHASAQLVARLTDHVLAIGCEQLRELSGAGVDIAMWIALAGTALTDVAHADRLLAIVRGRDTDPRRIVCAVGERAVRRSTPAELDVLTRLRVKGFGVCLDDFGGGHVSDDALARVPLTAVGLARPLVCGAARDPARAAALEDALEAVRGLGLPAVAKGCDDASDYELLLQVGCRHAEGEFIAGALPGDELTGWARRWRAPSITNGPR